MRCGFQELVSNLCYYKKPTAPLVSASAAVIAKPQPQRGSDRQYPLYFYGFSLLLNSSLFFLYLVSTFFKICDGCCFSTSNPIHTSHSSILTFLHSCPYSLFLLVSPGERQAHSLSPLCVFARTALPTIRAHYCQLCHLRLPERQEKMDGATLCQKSWAWCVFVVYL